MKFYLIDDQITLEALLAHSSPEVRRHATGALKALQKNAERITRKQDARLNANHTLKIQSHDDAMASCSHCSWTFATTEYRTTKEIQEIFNQSH